MLVGNWIFALAFFLGAKFVWHWTPAEWSTPGDKLALVFKCAAFAMLPGIVGICVVSAERLDPKMWVGRMAKPNSALDINTRFILNTFEQFVAFLVAIAVVALYSPPEDARALPILTVLFLLGRILFWIGYHKILICGRLASVSLSTRRSPSTSGTFYSSYSAFAYRYSSGVHSRALAREPGGFQRVDTM